MADIAEETQQQLLTLLDTEHDLLLKLMEIMQQEQSELLQGSPAEQLLSSKRTHLVELELATGRRLEWLRGRGVSPDRDGMLSIMARLNHEDQLAQRYSEFEATAASCRQKNDNLALIATRRESFMSRVLATLQSSEDAGLPTYSPSGDVKPQSKARLLGSA